MRIEIGQTIMQLRHARGITQEHLAEAVGVSAPAVSKWETGQSYPDIMLLAPLARYFDITVDTLLAYRPELTDDERNAEYERVNAVFDEKGWEAGLACCEALLREHPTDPTLRILLASGLMRNLIYADEQQREEGRARQIAWLKDAEAHADGNLALLTRYQLGTFYLSLRQLDEAETIFTSLEDIVINPRQAMVTLRMLQGRNEEAVRLAQMNLMASIADAVNALLLLTSLYVSEEKHDEATRYAEAGDAMLKALGLGKPFSAMTAQARMTAAKAAGDDEALLAAMEQYVGTMLQADLTSDSPMFDHVEKTEPGEASAAYDQALYTTLADSFEKNDAYDSVRDTERFQAILQALRGA